MSKKLTFVAARDNQKHVSIFRICAETLRISSNGHLTTLGMGTTKRHEKRGIASAGAAQSLNILCIRGEEEAGILYLFLIELYLQPSAAWTIPRRARGPSTYNTVKKVDGPAKGKLWCSQSPPESSGCASTACEAVTTQQPSDGLPFAQDNRGGISHRI